MFPLKFEERLHDFMLFKKVILRWYYIGKSVETIFFVEFGVDKPFIDSL